MLGKKEKEPSGKMRVFFRDSILLIIVAAVALEGISLFQYYAAKKGLQKEASLRAKNQLEISKLKICDIINQTETAVFNSDWIAEWSLSHPDSIAAISRSVVHDNEIIVGSTIAVKPGTIKGKGLYAPYSFRAQSSEVINQTSLATDEYNYPESEWFKMPLKLNSGYWSEPYVDVGGGEILMTTFSIPLHNSKEEPVAVLTADISLDWLTSILDNSRVYPHSRSLIYSRSGKVLGEVDDDDDDDNTEEGSNSFSLFSGISTEVEMDIMGQHWFLYIAPIEKTGWSMFIFIPEEDIFAGIRKVTLISRLLGVLGLLMIILILNITAVRQRRVRKLEEKKDKMENELRIGHAIQMSMLPKTFPPFPERKDIDMSASIVTAKEVGGDMYDFYIRDEKLFFCIGDVSGKGVPASLVMAVTRSLFRNVSAHESSPARIVMDMNDSMADINENNMFVTFFCGVLDLATGHVKYCNAGHNPPILLTTNIKPLDVEPNLPLGIMTGMQFTEQEFDMCFDDAMFLYTDGLTEAENKNKELFGEERMMKALRGRNSAAGKLHDMEDAVASYVGSAEQSDDLTMMFIHYTNEEIAGSKKRRLTLHNDIQQISLLEDFVNGIAKEAGFSASVASGINLALEEAATNVIMYAYPKGIDGICTIDAVIRPGSVEFIISDTGQPFDPTSVPPADTTLGVEERKIGGLGILMVQTIMDEVKYRYEDGKNILSMTKNN